MSRDHSERRRPRAGVIYMMLAALAFTAMIAFVKVARSELSPLDIMAWRGLLGAPLIAALALRAGRGFGLNNSGAFVLRTLFGFGAMFCFYTATRGLPLADLALIHKLQPILLAFLAPFVLGAAEKSDRSVWIVLVAGVVGCAILLAPKIEVGLEPGLWALGATGLSAGAHLCVRKLGATDEPAVVVLWFQLALTAIAVVVLGVAMGRLPSAPRHLWGVLLGCALSASAGQLFLTEAYRAERAARVAAASYVGPVWALVGDVVVFGVWPPAEALVGGAIIVGAGLLLLRNSPKTHIDTEGEESAAPVAVPR